MCWNATPFFKMAAVGQAYLGITLVTQQKNGGFLDRQDTAWYIETPKTPRRGTWSLPWQWSTKFCYRSLFCYNHTSGWWLYQVMLVNPGVSYPSGHNAWLYRHIQGYLSFLAQLMTDICIYLHVYSSDGPGFVSNQKCNHKTFHLLFHTSALIQ